MNQNTNIPFQSVLHNILDIDEKNRMFHAMDAETQKREVAYDALILMLIKKTKAHEGGYWSTELENFVDKKKKLKRNDGVVSSKEMCLLFNTKLPNCSVCARGSLMISLIRCGNSISSVDSNLDSGNRLNLTGFDINEFESAECEFEGFDYIKYDDKPYRSNTNKKLANILAGFIVHGKYELSDNTDYIAAWDLDIEN